MPLMSASITSQNSSVELYLGLSNAIENASIAKTILRMSRSGHGLPAAPQWQRAKKQLTLFGESQLLEVGTAPTAALVREDL